MTLFVVTIQRTVRRCYNSVTEKDVFIDPLFFDEAFRKKVNTMGKIWNQWNKFGDLTDARLTVKNVYAIEDDDWSAFMFSFRKLKISRGLEESKFIKFMFQHIKVLLVAGDEHKVSIQTVILQCGLCKESSHFKITVNENLKMIMSMLKRRKKKA